MKTPSHQAGNPLLGGRPETTSLPRRLVPETAYVQSTLARLPLAKSVVLL